MTKTDKILLAFGRICAFAFAIYITVWIIVAIMGAIVPLKESRLADFGYDRAFLVCRVFSHPWGFPGIRFVQDAPVEFCEGAKP